MHTLYDTATVPPFDRYEYYRAASAAEIAPVTVHGRPPGELRAVMAVAEIGDFEIESHAFAADREVFVRRTERLIRTSDPECYRVVIALTPGIRVDHAGKLMDFRARDIALYDTSQPWETSNPTGRIQTVMLTFPRALVPVDYAAVRPLVGSITPRSAPGRSALAQFLIGLIQPAGLEVPALSEVLYECVVGLMRQTLGEPSGITPRTRRLLQRAHIEGIIRRGLGNPALGPKEIATEANVSTRYLHALFQDVELKPMHFLKNLRLQDARRRLEDPALAGAPIGDIMTAVGYTRPDQFARDFRQMFGVSPKDHRQLSRGRQTS